MAKTLPANAYRSHELPLHYDAKNPLHLAFCFQLIFYSFVEHKKTRSGIGPDRWYFYIAKHREYFQQWFLHYFDYPLQHYDYPNNRTILIHYVWGRADHFLDEASKDGWRFGRKHWQIPDYLLQRYPQLFLQLWIAYCARIFIFVTRKLNPFRTALQLTQKSVNEAGLKQLATLFQWAGVAYSLGCQQSQYNTFVPTSAKRRKCMFFISLFDQRNLAHLFQQIGWDSLYYHLNPRVKVLHQVLENHLHTLALDTARGS